MIAGAALALLLLGSASGAIAADPAQQPPVERALPPPGESGWRPLPIPDMDRATAYRAFVLDGVRAVRAHSICSASALALELGAHDLRARPLLAWRWRVEWAPVIESHAIASGDDFALRVIAAFAPDPGPRARPLEGLLDPEGDGAELHYVWARRPARGESWPSPSADRTRLISMGGGKLDVWENVEVDLVADFERQFGRAPPPLRAVVLLSDTDDSCQEAAAYLGELRLRPREPARSR